MRVTAAVAGSIILLFLPSPVMGQGSPRIFTVTPTYQMSVGRFDRNIMGSEFRAWGVVMGREAQSRRWSPHLWMQWYEIEYPRAGVVPGVETEPTSGWSLTVGPAIEFIDRYPWHGVILPQAGFRSRGEGSLIGGVGVHFDLQVGEIRPQLFGRLQTMGHSFYYAMGVGVTLEFVWGEGR